MANRATITYNGNTISTEDRDGNFAITYNNSTIATVGAGQTKTLNCANKLMRTNVVVGGKTLNCAKYKMATDIIVSVVSLFPSEPSSYELIGTYTTSQTWTAPENGYFQIEVFGASGNGGEPYASRMSAGGGGGGGGGYACSRIKMNAGDTVVLTVGDVGADTSASINSTIETYSTMAATSGANGGSGFRSTGGTGGSGGVASEGNYYNANGNAGGKGSTGYILSTGATVSGGAGGTAGYTGGNVGGQGGSVTGDSNASPTSVSAGAGAAGFIKIYRGDTNLSGGNTSSVGYSVSYTGDLIDCTIEVYDATGVKRNSNTKIYTNDYILIDPGYTLTSLPSVSIVPGINADWTTSLQNGKLKITFTSIAGGITISAYL